MTAKGYLEQIRKKDKEIDRLQKEKDYLKDKMFSLGSCTAAGEKVQSSGDPDKIGTLVAQMDEQEQTIVEKIDQLVDLRKEALSLIYGLEDDFEKEILIGVYLDYKNISVIAEEIQRNDNTVRNKLKSGLLSLENRYPDFFSQQQDSE